jgi:hypothetical protein
MAEPDFTLLPVYASMQAHTQQTPVMYPGYFQEDHWAVTWTSAWEAAAEPNAVLGVLKRAGEAGAGASFVFDGTDLILVTRRAPEAGTLTVRVDGGPIRTLDLRAATATGPVYESVAQGLTDGPHSVALTSTDGANAIDGFIVRRAPRRTGWMLVGLVGVLGLVWFAGRRMRDEG